ncbi:MAG: DNA polymerase/3'-5' exonuclease PolX [Candidatus Omnitrophica bacterium]|nr:DNA polymerase/3'-5' exonuclease PolX [Candidatus Omnitrophota bacterium]
MPLALEKKEIVAILEEIGVLLELAGENPFKTRAYEAAARTLEADPRSLEDLIQSGELGKIKGIGKALEEKVVTLATTGELDYYSALRARFPESLFDLLRIPGFGPKKVKAVYEKLDIASLDALEAAAREGKLRALDGFGAKTEQNILEGIERVRAYQGRVLLPLAEQAAVPLFEWIRDHLDTIRSSLCGSLRRRRETIKDIDLLASSEKPDGILETFVKHPSVVKVTGHGGTKASVVLKSGMNADLRVVADEEFPFALNYFTGSKEHNTEMRARAKERGLRLNEYAFTREDGSRLLCKDEEEIYRTVGLEYVPPELRECTREFEWAEADKIPELLGYGDLMGTLHCHTTASDGAADLEQMAAAAEALGYQYLGIADHSKSAAYAGGLDEKRLARQWSEIDSFNKKSKGIRLLKGSEVDILKDGSLDFAEEVLADCDYAVASIHSLLNLDEAAMTQRLVRAIESPGITFLGHLSGRLLLQREPYPLNLAKVLDAAARNGKWIEINANPWRLDLDWRASMEAKERGILLVINPDAHSTEGISDNRYGIDVARRAGLAQADVANTRPLKEFLKILSATRPH